jgi:hypothetical protein
MKHILEKIGNYKSKIEDSIEESLIFDTNPLSDKEYNKLTEFLKLSKGQKLLEILHIIRKAVPKEFLKIENLNKFLYDTKELPFKPDKFSFEGIIGRGGGSKVYILKSLDKKLSSYVIKIIKNLYAEIILNNSEDAAVALKNEYEQIRSWYKGDAQKVFLPEYILKLKNPKNKKIAIAILQIYQGGEIKDIFNETKKEDLIKILQENEVLRKIFINFTEQTIKHADETQEILDFFGNKNLSLINDNGNYKLMVIDPHVIYKTSDDKNKCGEKAMKYLNYLKEISKMVK